MKVTIVYARFRLSACHLLACPIADRDRTVSGEVSSMGRRHAAQLACSASSGADCARQPLRPLVD